MRAEHRHELKTNELAEWIANLPQWAKENLRTIIYVSVVVVLVAGSGAWYWYNKNVESVQEELELTNLILQLPRSKLQILQAQASGVDASYLLSKPATDLETAARNAKSDQIAALALIKRAEALRMELHYRQSTISQIDVDAAMAAAKAAYSQALEKASANRSLAAIAKFGLGLCEEELGNFDGAGQIYRDITTDPVFEGTVAAAQAKLRLDTMADYKTKVVFRPAPTPEPRPSELPPIGPLLRPTDVNVTAQAPNAVALSPGISPGPNAPNTAPLLQNIDQWLVPPETVPTVPEVNRQPQAPNALPMPPDVTLSPEAANTATDVPDTNLPSR